MIIQKIPHYIDSMLTQEMARMALEGGKVVIAWYTNQENKQSVVHSHPYHELIIPFKGSMVQYSSAGSLYTLHVGELIFFPAEQFHSGKYDLTDTVSERLVIQVDADIWESAAQRCGLASPAWTKEVTILNADSVSTWDLRGLFERMAQSPYIKKQYQNAILESQLVEFQLLTNQIVEEKHTQAPSSTNALIAQAVAYLQENYTNPDLTVADLATYTYTSREYLSRSFKKYTMESIHGYLTNLRMQHCRRAIAVGTSILDACTESGFSNYSSFLKTFRRLYGMTPADYRNQLNELCGKYQLDLLEQTKTLSASAQQ